MLLSIFEKTSIGNTFLYQSLNTFSICLMAFHITLKFYFSSLLNILHLKLFFICQVFIKKLKCSFVLLILLIFDHRFSFDILYFFLSCQSQNFFLKQWCVLINKSKQYITSFIFRLFITTYLYASSIAKRQYSLALIIFWQTNIIFTQRKAFLTHFNQFCSYLLEITTQSYYLLQASKTSKIEKVSLVVNEEISHLI